MSYFKNSYQKALMTAREHISNNGSTINIYPDITADAYQSLFYILNFGSIKVKYPYSISLNPLNSYLLLYTTDGQGKLMYNEQNYILETDSIFMIDCRSSFHVEVFNSSSWSYKWFYLNGSHIDYMYTQYMKDQIPVHRCQPLSTIHHSFSKLIRYLSTKTCNELILSMLIDNLLTNLVVEKLSAKAEEQIPQYILTIQNSFDTRYFDTFDLDALAKRSKMSKYTLSRNFTKYINVSPIEYLINRRISVAKELLIETDYTVNEIANRIGIYNPTHFINLFKKRVGITPLQYRKQITKDLNIFQDP